MHIQRPLKHPVGIGHDQLIDSVFFHERDRFNGKPVESSSDLPRIVGATKPGSK